MRNPACILLYGAFYSSNSGCYPDDALTKRADTVDRMNEWQAIVHSASQTRPETALTRAFRAIDGSGRARRRHGLATIG